MPGQPTRSARSRGHGRRPRSGTARRVGVPAAVLGVLVAVSSCTAPVSTDPPPAVDSTQSDRPLFAPESPWYLPIPADPEVDDDSADMVEALTEDGSGFALFEQYGVPVYEADSSTPAVTVTCTKDWGACPLEEALVRIPDEATPSPGSDAAMVVIDRVAGRVYDFWQAERTSDDEWRVSWGTYAMFGGDGSGRGGGATAAGTNLLAGLVRMEELEAGRIDHALALVSDKSCPDVFRYPALKTDGHASEPPCIPQGARVQLDPSIDVASIPDITPGEVAVARALQTYGGYVRDSAGTALGIGFETPTDGDDDFYREVAGFPWDYYDMPHIPWDRLRVLAEWDGR
jgi:hypothetical protein